MSLVSKTCTCPDKSVVELLSAKSFRASSADNRTSQSSMSSASSALDMAFSALSWASASKVAHLGLRISAGSRLRPPATTGKLASLPSPSRASTAATWDEAFGPSAPSARTKAHFCDDPVALVKAVAKFSGASTTPARTAATAATRTSGALSVSTLTKLPAPVASGPRAARPPSAPTFAPCTDSLAAIAEECFAKPHCPSAVHAAPTTSGSGASSSLNKSCSWLFAPSKPRAKVAASLAWTVAPPDATWANCEVHFSADGPSLPNTVAAAAC
mmetsp:Transcript_29045/g.52909  ORF Transcript_29045/g.52909 Transcript_29045/m.52909 type:complete len:272 (-) Transcript_29045:422-1237(-)